MEQFQYQEFLVLCRRQLIPKGPTESRKHNPNPADGLTKMSSFGMIKDAYDDIDSTAIVARYRAESRSQRPPSQQIAFPVRTASDRKELSDHPNPA